MINAPITLTLTPTEAAHLARVLFDAEVEGSYYGNRGQYWARHERIIEKLRAAIMAGGETKA